MVDMNDHGVAVDVEWEHLADPAVEEALIALIRARAAQERQSSRKMGAKEAPAGPMLFYGDEGYSDFIKALPKRSQQFLELVRMATRDGRELGIEEVMEKLGVKVGKAMGGVAGSINRWAPEHNAAIPYEAIRGTDGKRAWIWIGGLRRHPKPPVPVRRPRRKKRT